MKNLIVKTVSKWINSVPICKQGGVCNTEGVIYKRVEWHERKLFQGEHKQVGAYCTKCMRDTTQYLE